MVVLLGNEVFCFMIVFIFNSVIMWFVYGSWMIGSLIDVEIGEG